jgi:hypothetical protein
MSKIYLTITDNDDSGAIGDLLMKIVLGENINFGGLHVG